MIISRSFDEATGVAKLEFRRDMKYRTGSIHTRTFTGENARREANAWMDEEVRYRNATAQRNIENDQNAKRMREHRDRELGRCYSCHGMGDHPTGADDRRDGPLSVKCRTCGGDGKATCGFCGKAKTGLGYQGPIPICGPCAAENDDSWKYEDLDQPMEEPPEPDPRD